MKLYLNGHDYKYAVEQIMLMMFPGQRPEYDRLKDEVHMVCHPKKATLASGKPKVDSSSHSQPNDPDSDELAAEITLTRGRVYATAHTRLYCHGCFDGYARVRLSELTDKLVTDRLLQKIIKLSFFKAARTATGQNPVWGALTGIRPGKLVTNMLEQGLSESQALHRLCREYYVTPERGALCLDTAKASRTIKHQLHPRDIALYVGIPFCPSRCAYCSFVSHSVEKAKNLIPPFLDALYREIDGAAETVRKMGLRIISVYIGGGTPTTLTAGQLDTLLAKLDAAFDLSDIREYTVEAGRPDTITPEKLATLRMHGITRVSINPQTMSDEVLAAIGRRHTARDVTLAMEMARHEMPDSAVNMDLIAGLPADTPERFRHTLDTIIGYKPENITVHTLALKKGTRVTLEKMNIPSGDAVSEMLDYAACRLRAEGYSPYYLYRQKFMSGGFENIGWCKPGYESIYNICIMEELCTILALGGGGISKLVAPTGRIERIFNAKYPYEYIQNIEKSIAGKDALQKFYAALDM